MMTCIPVERVLGLDSEICPNLRAAPALLLLDDASGKILCIDTTSGVCGAIPADIDVLIFSGGMGRGMFQGLQRQGVRVFATDARTVGEALQQLSAGGLQEVEAVASCSGGRNQHQHRHDDSADDSCGCGAHAGQAAWSGQGCGCAH